jgi:hypothetical protein
MKLRARSRKVVVAAAATLTFIGGIAGAQAGLIGTSAAFTTTQTIPLPVVPTTYHELGEDAAHAYTPSLQGGSVTVSVTSSTAAIGAVVADTGFSCPADAPNPVVSLGLSGISGSARVTARLRGTTILPDGTPSAYDVSLSPVEVSPSANGTQLYKLCTA